MSRILMIVGTGFSGSTLLSLLLNAHPEMVGVGEAQGPYTRGGDPSLYPCSCGRELAGCPFWKAVGDAMAARGRDFGPERWDVAFALSQRRWPNLALCRSLRNNALDDLRDGLVGQVPGWRRRLDELARRNEALVESILQVSGARLLVDASKDPARAWALERLTSLEPRVVHLVRDAPGYVSSYMSNKQVGPEGGIRDWNRMAAQMERLWRRLPAERKLRVRYEDLCRDPQGELQRISGFVGLAPPPWPLDYQAAEHHVIGNRMRLSGSSQVRLDERWRERLDAAQLAEVERRTERHRRRYGYMGSA